MLQLNYFIFIDFNILNEVTSLFSLFFKVHLIIEHIFIGYLFCLEIMLHTEEIKVIKTFSILSSLEIKSNI